MMAVVTCIGAGFGTLAIWLLPEATLHLCAWPIMQFDAVVEIVAPDPGIHGLGHLHPTRWMVECVVFITIVGWGVLAGVRLVAWLSRKRG